MKRIMLMVVVALVMAAMLMFVGPAAAQGGGCKAFGENIGTLATALGGGFGQAASGSAPLNDTVEAEQAALCE